MADAPAGVAVSNKAPQPAPAASEDPGPEPYVPDPEIDLEGVAQVRTDARARCKRHGWIGVAISFAVMTLGGLPSSLAPVTLVVNGVSGLLFGFPLGYLASYGRVGMYGGAMLGAAFGAAFAVLGFLLYLIQGGEAGAASLVVLVLRGLFAGIIPGAFVGFHLESDD